MKARVLCLLLAAGCSASRPRPANPAEWRAAWEDCETGNHGACMWVGTSLEDQGDAKGAFAKYEAACEAGFAEGCQRVGESKLRGIGVAKDPAQAFGFFERSCAGGASHGCHMVALAYERGNGVTIDVAKAAVAYARACELHDEEACTDFGHALAQGRGLPADLKRARALWRERCPKTDGACVALGVSLEGDDPAQALEVFREGCRHGDEHSCREFGLRAENDGSVETALRYYRTACAWGEAKACLLLAKLVFAADPREAVLVWREQCSFGRKPACVKLAERDPALAEEQRTSQLKKLCSEKVTEACTLVCEREPTEAGCKPVKKQ